MIKKQTEYVNQEVVCYHYHVLHAIWKSILKNRTGSVIHRSLYTRFMSNVGARVL